jgi:prophage antirepressor-like protein
LNELIPFHFDGKEVRVELDEHGKPWWFAKDICAVLGLKNVSDAVGRLLQGEKRVAQVDNALIINESGLYRLIFRSDKREAQRFQTWVFEEVLPAIRKTGRYDTTVKSSGDMLVEMALAYREQEKRLCLMEAQQHQTQTQMLTQQQALIHTQEIALAALRAMQWVTVRQYVSTHDLVHQMPPALQQQYAKWLSRYCLEHGLPMYKAPTADKEWPYEKTYSIIAIHDTLPGWLQRRTQTPLTVVTEKETTP